MQGTRAASAASRMQVAVRARAPPVRRVDDEIAAPPADEVDDGRPRLPPPPTLRTRVTGRPGRRERVARSRPSRRGRSRGSRAGGRGRRRPSLSGSRTERNAVPAFGQRPPGRPLGLGERGRKVGRRSPSPRPSSASPGPSTGSAPGKRAKGKTAAFTLDVLGRARAVEIEVCRCARRRPAGTPPRRG